MSCRAASLVLVHGAWHGGWCWSRVAALCRAAGVDSHALTLTGLGERSHLLTPEVGLETHVADVVGLVRWEEPDPVVLVAHSYAGVFIGAAAERLGGRVAGIVYLDALVPELGASALSLYPPEVAAALEAGARGWRLPPWPAASFGVADPADQAWVDRLLTDHPFRTFTEPGGTPPPAGPKLTYVFCADRRRDSYLRFAEAARRDPAWDYRELPCGHDAMVIAPGPLAEILVAAARA